MTRSVLGSSLEESHENQVIPEERVLVLVDLRENIRCWRPLFVLASVLLLIPILTRISPLKEGLMLFLLLVLVLVLVRVCPLLLLLSLAVLSPSCPQGVGVQADQGAGGPHQAGDGHDGARREALQPRRPPQAHHAPLPPGGALGSIPPVQYVRTPRYNPEARRYARLVLPDPPPPRRPATEVRRGVTISPRQGGRRDIEYCGACSKFLPRSSFNMSAGSASLSQCQACRRSVSAMYFFLPI